MAEPSLEVFTQSRKGKERQAPLPTDFADKLIALQRRQAHATKPRERAERTTQPASSTSTPRPPRPPSPRRLRAPPLQHPNIVVSQPSPAAAAAATAPDEHDFSRRLKISPASPRNAHAKADHPSPRPQSGRLYNPNADPVRSRPVTAEPDAMSDAASSAYAPRPSAHLSRSHLRSQPARPSGDAPRLFDYRKDNPHQFAIVPRASNPPTAPSPPVLARQTPTPKSSGDWVSASSTSSASYAHSTISSNFTLSSTTTDSSTGSALFDNNAPRSEDSAGPSALSSQLKRLYRGILSLEARVQSEDRDREVSEDADRALHPLQRVDILKPGAVPQEYRDAEDAEKERYRRMVSDHKELADMVHRMLSLTLAPTVPQSLKSIPIKYNLVFRLWNHGFHRLLELLRRGAMQNSDVALEYLQEFIYYAYTFYTNLVEEQNLSVFRGGWVESLGDIARYRIAVSSMIEMNAHKSASRAGANATNAITSAALSASHLLPTPQTNTPDFSAMSDKNVSPTPAGTPSPMRSKRHHQDDSSLGQEHEEEQAHEQQRAPGNGIPSVGIAAARLMVLEPERERWRQISRDWYLKGLAFTPGSGKLHHHLGILSSREAEHLEKEELRAVYHFVKSMITMHPFETSREAILWMWSGPALARRQAPDASLTELFIHLHGMLFTNIQLDDFKPMLARFEEKLLIEGADVEERDWIMMAVINIGAVLEYGRPTAVLRRVAGASASAREAGPNASASPVMANGGGRVKLMTAAARKAEAAAAAADDRRMDIDDDVRGASPLLAQPSPTMSISDAASGAAANQAAAGATAASESELPFALRMALQLTFTMLSHTLARPLRERATPFRRQTLNPYVSVVLTFLATVLQERRDRTAERVLARAVPWEALARFLATVPRKVMAREAHREGAANGLLSAGTPPLPEDWCLRGLAWGGRKIYERGFWDRVTGGEEKNLEAEVLDRVEEAEEMMDGIIEDEDEDERGQGRVRAGEGELAGRWVRVARAGLKIGRAVSGFAYVPPSGPDAKGAWRVEGALAEKVGRWREEARRAQEEEARRMRGTRWVDDDDSMDVDEDEGGVDESGSSEDDEDDTDEVRALKDRRRYLQSLLASSQVPRSPQARRRPRGPSLGKGVSRLRVVPGYTILVVDTNILLSSLPMVAALVESRQWTVVLPLPVIMELDGLASNRTPLGEAAGTASQYVAAHMRTHTASLKVQTSRGNYLPNLNVRTEQVDFDAGGRGRGRDGDGASWERSMDDLILRAAMWQHEHWVDRSAFLDVGDAVRDTAGASKVVLLSFDRNLRLKARAREVDAANEQELASILAAAAAAARP